MTASSDSFVLAEVRRRRLGVAAVLAAWGVLFSRSLIAHDFPQDTMMTAFAKVEPHELHLVIRVPLDLLTGAQFPATSRNEIDLAAARPAVQRAVRAIGDSVTIWADGVRLPPSSETARLSLPSDRSFEDYVNAVAHVGAPLSSDTEIYFGQGYLDAHFAYRISSSNSKLAIQTTFARDLKDYVKLAVRFLPLDGLSRSFIITSRAGRVALDPTWYQATRGFVVLGIGHILSGADHLLFLLCLILPFRRIRDLLAVITAFTVGHSVTLIGTAYNGAPAGQWFAPFVETAIAASIVYMAAENIVGADLGRRWLITGLFGLVHGFGFSYALRQELQFAGSHLVVSLFSFNVGIEIGQLAVIAVMLAGLSLAFRGVMAGRMGITLLSAVVAHTAWHWMIDRGNVLWQTEWPRLDGPALVILARWIAGILVAASAARLLGRWVERTWPARNLGGVRLEPDVPASEPR